MVARMLRHIALLVWTSMVPTLALAQAPGFAEAGAGGPRPGSVREGVQAGQPFAPLSAEAQKRLDQLLAKWEGESQATKLLSCDFNRWHYDVGAAPGGVPATWAKGVVKYAAPDKGMFRVDTLKFYKGMKDGKPTYESDAKQFGEYWVCNGAEVLEFDRSKEECTIQQLPEQMRGQQILESPLPFVFNLDAKKIQERYWVREVPPPPGKAGIYLLEAWPKRQQDRSQYRFVQIAINADTFLPDDLVIYAPNFDPQTAPVWDHYEFTEMKRNGLVANLQQFMDGFIKVSPPRSWKVIREPYGAVQQASARDTRQLR